MNQRSGPQGLIVRGSTDVPLIVMSIVVVLSSFQAAIALDGITTNRGKSACFRATLVFTETCILTKQAMAFSLSRRSASLLCEFIPEPSFPLVYILSVPVRIDESCNTARLQTRVLGFEIEIAAMRTQKNIARQGFQHIEHLFII